MTAFNSLLPRATVSSNPGVTVQGFDNPPGLPVAVSAAVMPNPLTPPVSVPQTGLAGAEQALTTGTQGNVDVLQGALATGTEAIQTGAQGAQDFLNQAGQVISAGTQTAQNLLTGATGTLQQGQEQGIDFLTGTTQQAVQPLQQFVGTGFDAQQEQAARLGLLGPEAQAAALQRDQDDPAQLALQESQIQALRLAGLSEGAGTRGGRIRQGLARFGLEFSAEQEQNRLRNLQSLSGAGLQAAGQAGNILSQSGVTGANLIGQTSANIARVETLGADLAQQGANAQGDINRLQANIEQSTGVNLAELEQATGINIGQALQNLGSNQAEVRTQAGRDISQAINSAATAQANLVQGQGQGIADISAGQIADVGNVLTGEAQQQATLQQNLATLLSNLAVGEGTSLASIANTIGEIEAAGVLGTNSSVQTALSALAELLGQREGESE